MVDLGTLGGSLSTAAVNNRGQAVGYSYRAADTAYHALLWQLPSVEPSG